MAKVRKNPEDVRTAEPATQHSGVTTAAEVARERVALRAYEIYMEHGSQDGRALDDWLEAERELLSSTADRDSER